jgi:hypothetical protein
MAVVFAADCWFFMQHNQTATASVKRFGLDDTGGDFYLIKIVLRYQFCSVAIKGLSCLLHVNLNTVNVALYCGARLMKLKLIVSAMVCTLAVSGCQSIPEEDMALPVAFSQRAQQFPVKHPAVTFSDEAFHQNFGPFRIDEMDLSGKYMQKVTMDTGWKTSTTGGLLFQLLFHDTVNTRGDLVSDFSTRAEQSFNFNVAAAGLAPVHSDCQLLVFGTGEETLDNGVNSYNWQTSQPVVTYFGCRLTQNGQISELVVERKAGSAPTFRLHQGKQVIDLTPVHSGPDLSQYNALYQPVEVGYLFAKDAVVQSAQQLSLNQSRLWLGNEVTPAQQQWLLAVMFSLQMYHWQDRNWPAQS